MIVHFYCCDPAAAEIAAAISADFRCWRPDTDGAPPKGSRTPTNYFWWILSRAGAFAQPGFAELCIEQEGKIIHRLIVTPGWFRFPFMARGDLQIGNVWTAPAARRRGLAQASIAEAHRQFGRSASRFWYVIDADNAASAAVARSCGYRLVAVGRRTRPLGLALLGRFVIDRFVQRGEIATHEIAPACSDESTAGRSLSVSH